jgi:hypothetical protein
MKKRLEASGQGERAKPKWSARLKSINEREIRVHCTIYFAMRTEKFFLTAVD